MLLAITLGGLAVFLLRLPPLVLSPGKDTSFGIFENRQLIERINNSGTKTYIIKDSLGNYLFTVPLENCVIDYRYRNGKLAFKDESTGRRGFIDANGSVIFTSNKKNDIIQPLEQDSAASMRTDVSPLISKDIKSTHFKDADIRAMVAAHPFSQEAKKVLSGNLEETDSLSRRQILSYCEHLRTAYTTKDIDFLRQVFSDNALIIVGHTVKRDPKQSGMSYGDKVRYNVRTKQSYLERVSEIFDSNKTINIVFSNFRILRHPTVKGIYGVTLRQKYSNDNYSDDGYLFLLWDFRDAALPRIHVRTWQPETSIRQGEELIDISDFNLE